MVSEIAVQDKMCTKNGSMIAMMHNVLNFEWIEYVTAYRTEYLSTSWEYSFLGTGSFQQPLLVGWYGTYL